MSMVSQMMGSMPTGMMDMDMPAMQECIEACSAAAQAAVMCADADAAMDGMAACAGMCNTTADVATTMMRMMMRPSGYDMAAMTAMMQATIAMGTACARECQSHAEMADHCRICAQACDAMVEKCRSMMSMMTAAS